MKLTDASKAQRIRSKSEIPKTATTSGTEAKEPSSASASGDAIGSGSGKFDNVT